MTAKRNRNVLLLALLLASVSAVLAYLLISSRPVDVPVVVQAPLPSGEPVLIGARPIASGEPLTADNIEIAYVAPEAKGARVLTESAQAIGKIAMVDIPKGEQILAGSVSTTASSAPAADTFAQDVPVGMRAVAIALEETVGVGGFVRPGDRVDVIASYELIPPKSEAPASQALEAIGGLIDQDLGGESEDPFAVAELIVQDVEVLAVGQSLGGLETAAPPPAAAADAPAAQSPAGPTPNPTAMSVSLLVDPTQALRLLLAVESDGTFRLLLRAPGDATTTELPPALVTSGGIQMDPFKLMGANLVEKDVVITDARFRQTTIPAGGILEFEATVRNVSSQLIPAGRGGAGPGHVYSDGISWQSLADVTPVGVYSIGITSDATDSQTYPWRWDLGADLAPGQTATISGGIQVPNVPGVQRWWFGTLLQPGTVLEDGVSPTEITIEPITAVVVAARETDMRESPWPSAESVLQLAQGSQAEVLDYRDGWFLIRSGGSDGWVSETAVTNAALPEATADATPVASSQEQT
jgi:pilus assembly protein CpaB